MKADRRERRAKHSLISILWGGVLLSLALLSSCGGGPQIGLVLDQSRNIVIDPQLAGSYYVSIDGSESVFVEAGIFRSEERYSRGSEHDVLIYTSPAGFAINGSEASIDTAASSEAMRMGEYDLYSASFSAIASGETHVTKLEKRSRMLSVSINTDGLNIENAALAISGMMMSVDLGTGVLSGSGIISSTMEKEGNSLTAGFPVLGLDEAEQMLTLTVVISGEEKTFTMDATELLKAFDVKGEGSFTLGDEEGLNLIVTAETEGDRIGWKEVDSDEVDARM